MNIESDDQRRESQKMGYISGSVNNRAVAQMNAIEEANGGHAPLAQIYILSQ
jgi:hypothetical protein